MYNITITINLNRKQSSTEANITKPKEIIKESNQDRRRKIREQKQ